MKFYKITMPIVQDLEDNGNTRTKRIIFSCWEWYHITCQWSNGSGNQPRGIYVYVNGQLEGYTDMVGNDGGYQHWHLGGSYGCLGDKTHNCYLGPIMFYKNYNLTDDEVLQNYNAHSARFGR